VFCVELWESGSGVPNSIAGVLEELDEVDFPKESLLWALGGMVLRSFDIEKEVELQEKKREVCGQCFA
jgi:hypothetical protein